MSEHLATVGLRLMPEVDEEMRNHVRRRGDLAKLIIATLEGVDLNAIPLLEVNFVDVGVRETLCKIPAKLYNKATSTASERGVSTNCLLNSAISVYTKQLKKRNKLDKQ